jgi:TonB family protein
VIPKQGEIYMPILSGRKAVKRQLIFILLAFSFLLAADFDVFSQTGSKKLVRCRENGKIVYRTKCRIKRKKIAPSSLETVTELKNAPPTEMVTERYGSPTSNRNYEMTSDGPGSGGGQGPPKSETGSGSANRAEPPAPARELDKSGNAPLNIISRPRAVYTDEARAAQVNGTVTLRITFLADGTIGKVSPVSGLPNGLTNQAVEAAKRIRFQPAMKKGKPITVRKLVQYNFTLY